MATPSPDMRESLANHTSGEFSIHSREESFRVTGSKTGAIAGREVSSQYFSESTQRIAEYVLRKLKKDPENLFLKSCVKLLISEHYRGQIGSRLLERLESLLAKPSVTLGEMPTRMAREFHAWKLEEENDIQKMSQFLARSFWDNREKGIPPKLREFLGEEQVDDAIKANDFEAFLALFNGLSVDELWGIRTNENCHPLGFVKTEPYTITEADKVNIKQYLDDIGFSGAVTLSDAHGTYTICPTARESLESASFSINSISKVFTGALALMTMPTESFHRQLELAPSVLQTLKELNKPVHAHLEKPTLLQTMNHRGGFGDFLLNYQKAIESALERGDPVPEIHQPEDFLQFADTALHEIGQPAYSNLGILLVSLAVQHQCGDKPFNQLLQELILDPANINLSISKPEGGKFDPTDPTKGKVSGSPSGGYWTTSKELIKLGIWLADKCRRDPEFFLKMEKYGNEFYVSEDREIRHNGCSSAGSSCLSSFLDSGVTISILSDQGNFMADRIYYTIRKNIIEKP